MSFDLPSSNMYMIYIYICTHTHSATFLQKKIKLYFIACVRLSTTKEADSRALADPTPKKV
jgi:hypothetical protein